MPSAFLWPVLASVLLASAPVNQGVLQRRFKATSQTLKIRMLITASAEDAIRTDGWDV